jgi:hypothetical protein
LKLCIVWDWHVDPQELLTDKQAKLQAWRGLALNHEVHICVLSETFAYSGIQDETGTIYNSFVAYNHLLDFIVSSKFDRILTWGSVDRPIHCLLLTRKDRLPPVSFQFAGGPHEGNELALFDLIFTQNLSDKLKFDELGKRTIQVFGVDKQFWSSNTLQEKLFEVIYPASFCSHKRNEVVSELYEQDAVLVGKWDDMRIVDECKSFGSLVLPYTPHETLRELYRASKKCVIPAIAGSQRTLVEAQSCGLEIELISDDNYKCKEILDGKIEVLSIKGMTKVYEEALCHISSPL